MIKFLKILISIIIIINFTNISYSKENFYAEGVKLFNDKKYKEAKFLFERNGTNVQTTRCDKSNRLKTKEILFFLIIFVIN